MVDFSELVGTTLREIRGLKPESDRVDFVTEAGTVFILYHSQDCCESVSVNEVVGDISDLIGTPILVAEERSGGYGDDPIAEEFKAPDEYAESWTWTFYELRTIKGSVTIRWLGESNGYYSESVYFGKDDALEGRRAVSGLLT